jgi:hypothetical protein
LKRHLSVYRAWNGIEAPAPLSYAVLQDLQDHPNRAEIVNEKPKLTKREAREIMGQYKGKKNEESSGGRREETGRWLQRVFSLPTKLAP